MHNMQPIGLDVYAMEYDSAYTSPMDTPTKATIDYSKFKTKLCRNYLMGMQCPFQDRCAFAHGPEEQQQVGAMANAAAMSHAAAMTNAAASPTSVAGPPSYDAFVGASAGPSRNESSEDLALTNSDSRPSTPPAYPTKFRYEPYSAVGIIFAH